MPGTELTTDDKSLAAYSCYVTACVEFSLPTLSWGDWIDRENKKLAKAQAPQTTKEPENKTTTTIPIPSSTPYFDYLDACFSLSNPGAYNEQPSPLTFSQWTKHGRPDLPLATPPDPL